MNTVYFLCVCIISVINCSYTYQQADELSPFKQDIMDIRRKHREYIGKFETVIPKKTYQKYSVRAFSKIVNNRRIFGHHAVVYDAKSMFSVLEPLKRGGCKARIRSTVAESAKQRSCVVAVNAGFTHPDSDGCYGNVISDSILVQQMNSIVVKNVNFGVRQDGSIIVGEIPEKILTNKNPFEQLVSGIGWVLRNGESFVNESLKLQQCSSGNIVEFTNTKSARTFIGYDDEAHIHIVQVDGQTGLWGINLHDAANLLKSFQITNAVNLDGGGASTFVVNQTVVNYPSNSCYKDGFESLCPFNVTTILCIHASDSCNKKCSLHSICHRGKCICSSGWYGKECQLTVLEPSSSWKNYKIVIGLSVSIGILLVINIFTCNLAFLYYTRYRYLVNSSKEKDQLRHYLQSQRVLSSTETESDEHQ